MDGRLTGQRYQHDGDDVLHDGLPRVDDGHDVLGVRLARGARAERHGRVARLPQQQIVLEERGHGHRRGIQQRDDFHRLTGAGHRERRREEACAVVSSVATS